MTATVTIEAGDSLIRKMLEAGYACPRCGWRVATGRHGWVEAGGVLFAAPCPCCSPVSNENCDDERCAHTAVCSACGKRESNADGVGDQRWLCQACVDGDDDNACSYCGEPVDEENDAVFYTTAYSADHYACVPLSEKLGE